MLSEATQARAASDAALVQLRAEFEAFKSGVLPSGYEPQKGTQAAAHGLHVQLLTPVPPSARRSPCSHPAKDFAV